MFSKIDSKKRKSSRKKMRINIKGKRIEVPDGLYNKCTCCEVTLNVDEIKSNNYKCPKCNHHFRMRSADRIKMVFDSFEEFNHRLKTKNPLDFPGYTEKINGLVDKEGINEAVVTGVATIDGYSVVGIVMDPFFMMGSMGSVVGEKITRAFENATRLDCPVVLFSASGGARMQEGMFSLMQMAKTSAAVGDFSQRGGLYINVLTDPTTGGVTASFAMLADITLAEPKTLVGFAGPRVIEQTIKQKLPENFQTAEFVLDKGFIDKVVDRSDMKMTIKKILMMHEVK